MIQVINEKITINGQDVILFGAELHYFRVPKSEWRNRIREAKESGINMISTYVPWIFHEYEEGQIDLTGKTRGERDLQTFLEIVAEEGMYCLVRPGPYVMAEIVDHGVPTWFIDNYPEAVAKTKGGDDHPTRVVSYMHPIYLEKVEIWYQAVCAVIEPFQITNGGSVIMFQLDNEVGMFHWVSNQGDYNKVTEEQFVDYLRKKYSLVEFQQLLEENVSDIGEFINTNVRQPKENHAIILRNEYSLFMREHYRLYLEHLKDLAEKNKINLPFVVNIHGFHEIDILKRGTMYPIGISQLVESAKIDNTLMAGDYYIGNIEYDNYIDIVLANVFTKAIQSKDQPLFSAEFQGGKSSDKPRLQPYTFDLTTRLCFANGMNAVNYYMFVGGENYEGIGLLGRRHEWQAPLGLTGEKRPHFSSIQHLGKMFQVYGESLPKSKQKTATTVAFYPDYYMTEFSDSYTLPIIETFQKERDLNLYNGLAKGLRLNNIVFDGLNLLEAEPIDVSKVPTLWMFSMKWMDGVIQQKLVNYIDSGGHLVLYPSLPTKDLNNRSCTILKDYIDVEVLGRKEGFMAFQEIDSIQTQTIELYSAKEGVFAWTEDDERNTVGFEKSLGQGKVFVFGVQMDLDFNYKLNVYRQLAERVGVVSPFKTDDELDISIRAIDNESYFIFLHNFDDYKKESTLSYNSERLFDGHILSVPRRSGLMLPVNIKITEDVTLKWGTAEVFEVEESEDIFTITVKLKQANEVLCFQSANWYPKAVPDIEIEEKDDSTFLIKLSPSLEEKQKITFEKNVLGSDSL
ncbi:beta-galactosidase [Bacillus sp. JJ1562]|uniref:beta-galactosidase n=1 Tax=Bacillus sp. JJ1562 TaxID=3122960 RepID=UPI0030012F53